MERTGDEELMTVAQAATFLQLSQSSIRAYIRQGRLKAYRVAGRRRVLIPKKELLNLLEPARLEEPTKDGTIKGNA